ncbi:MAG: hypothetical protein E6J90_41735 [Deltaproteobacteria bacterium]|nr:MAG: hypothetical protein E6J90_41735 [Deltaproteobacteria bacterium]TMQ11216.1 MAG: hypothetical protein E6J91_23935 [Deltaproteobacteria bacterium]
MKKLNSATFAPKEVASGGQTQLDVTWTSDEDGTLFLSYHADWFTLAPNQIPLTASGAGHTQVSVTVTRHGGTGDCDVHFWLGSSDALDWVSVT